MENDKELYHYGILGQRWGVRRFQHLDRTYTEAGKKRYAWETRSDYTYRLKNLTKHKRSISDKVRSKIENTKAAEKVRKTNIGKKYSDTYLNKNTDLYRIQSNSNFENHAFYATYKNHDINEYAGLFGKNLKTRADREARVAEKKARLSGSDVDKNNAAELRKKADEMSIHQVKLGTNKTLKIPSEENAGTIINALLRDKGFKSDLIASLKDSKSKMLRPSQQLIFDQALNAIIGRSDSLSKTDLSKIYQALNLSLTNHNEEEVRMQNKFYKALKANGYNALLDLNDKSYSSYHAHSPVIVFDTDSVKLQSVTQLDQNTINQLYTKHNIERLIKDAPEIVVGTLSRYGSATVEEAKNYVDELYKKKIRGQ